MIWSWKIMSIKVLDYTTRKGGEEYILQPGDSFSSCCGSRIAGERQVYEERYDEDADEYDDVLVDCDFDKIDQGIIVQSGEHGVPGDNGREAITHVKTSNGTISVKIRYVW
jgi:hypothetical protein